MSSIAEVIAKHASVSERTAAQSELDTIWDEGISLPEKVSLQEAVRGRLVTTYLLAAEGKLLRDQDVGYLPPAVTSEEERALDVDVLSDLLEATHREVDCQVCYNLMLDPVTTSCGHTLCRNCLARVLDHSQHCPVCRRGLAIPPSLHGQSSNKTLVQLLNGLCSEAVSARAEAVALEETGGPGGLNVPLFVCTLGFPNQPTFLRIFEPRYRLMLRRCIEGNKEFGMLMYNRYLEPQGDLGPVHFYHYGIMLRIVHSQMLADGTSLIETRGIYRFRVKAHDVLDGYAVGSVERLEDVSLTEEERLEAIETSLPPVAEDDVAGRITRMSTQQLLAVGQDFIRRMQARSANWLQQRVLDIHGLPPDDAAMFPYWFASVLPISDEEKYKLMGTTTVRQRLKITASWIRRIESQRWYQSNSCRIL
ncbi:ATP-dependent protease-like protein [Hortaea werneckii]|nr:ATP-dependent protease-like protein [Hortaea werneckii]KAI6822241.1 ATP-dependent protease-like protein [Hortaea werneckii]KAI6907329.1 ATP-dependent protease-like protein [Hortaea werneckii]KAI6926093.1 ATP-dependent protease-like protein [Hortaea werneckii]KAI6969614.1 ATP-dependent protease-like protein [Hortaea werneckii]